MIRIAVLGYGTVGSGVVKVIQTNAKIIAKRAGQEVEVKYVLDLRDFPDDPIQSKVVHDFNVILEDRKSTRLNSSHIEESRMPSSA